MMGSESKEGVLKTLFVPSTQNWKSAIFIENGVPKLSCVLAIHHTNDKYLVTRLEINKQLIFSIKLFWISQNQLPPLEELILSFEFSFVTTPNQSI